VNGILRLYVENRRIIMLTFEIFWIIVFLLHAASSSSGAQIAQFQYVNF
jgi:hypothetical protein